MICFNIPFVTVGFFLLLTFVVGIYFSRKESTFLEYAVGNKKFSTATLVATVLATNFGGAGLLRNVQQVHNLGLYWIVIYLLIIFRLWTMSWLALRMGPFMKHLSMAETIGSVYGKYPRIITALLSICKSIIAITSQIIVMTEAVSICVDFVDPRIITAISALLLIFYSTFGGIRAVTFTDILQFITFAVIIPLLAWFMFVKVGKPVVEIIPLLQTKSKFQFNSLFHFDIKLINMGTIILCCLTPCIEPSMIQRIYMASGPIQAKKVFSYAAIFSFVIRIFIILIGLFVFIRAPELMLKDIWTYIMYDIPSVFKGFVAISLLAMAMSTADSELNSCSIMVSHDIVESILGANKSPYAYQLRLARIVTLVIGLLAMIVSFYCKDLLKLMFWTLDLDVIIVAPFILAVFGFRGSSKTALIGMTIGALAILSWNKWLKPLIGINGAFACMLINILAMVVAHYLLKQPDGSGWVKPDDKFKQMQQENQRKKAARKESIKNCLTNRKLTLAKLVPSHTTLRYVGLYVLITNLLIYFTTSIVDHVPWFMFQLLVGAYFLGYSTFFQEKRPYITGWIMGLLCVIGLSFCLPINVLWHWWRGTNLFLTLGLSLSNLSITLMIFPLYLGISFLIITILIAICLSSVYYTKTLVLSPLTVIFLLLFCLVLGLLIFGILVFIKAKNNRYSNRITYLNDKEKIKEIRRLKSALYDAALVPSNGVTSYSHKGHGFILNQVVRKVEESISFLDSKMPLYKQDLQSIINKFYDWIAYFNRRERAKYNALIQPTKITLDKLIRKVEVTLSQEAVDPPKILIEEIDNPNGALPDYIVCDVNQVVYLLVQAVIRVNGNLDRSSTPVIRIQLHATALQFKKAEPIDNNYPSFIDFQATALVVSDSTVAYESLPKVKDLYNDTIDDMGFRWKKGSSPSIDLQQQTISIVIQAHYGYLEDSSDQKQSTMLLVLPNDVTEILSKMSIKLPIDALTSEATITPKEQADSMVVLMQFHDYICKFSHQEDPIDMKIISNLILLLRKHFGFKRNASGQLFYVRSVGIAALVVEWVFHSPKVIYAALLYELVRRTCLPISYIEKHYNLGVYAFVLNVVGIDKRQDLDHPSLLYVKNRLKEAIKEGHVQLSVLFIKLAERLYDLRHAAGYIHLTEVQHMAQETLAIDVQIANTYLGKEIGIALEQAAKKALEVFENTNKEKGIVTKK